MSQVVMVNGVARCSSNLEFIVKMDPSPAPLEPIDGELLRSEVVSTPNGMSYGKPGFVPHDHKVVLTYENCVKEFDGLHSKVVSRVGQFDTSRPFMTLRVPTLP